MNNKTTQYGELTDNGGFYIHVDVCHTTVNEKKVQCSLINGVVPVVSCEETNKRFTLSWNDIVHIAIERGLLEIGDAK